MIAKYAAICILLAALVVVASPGCHRASATDEDHLEHHVPPHKPSNLSGAIDQIERRFEALAHGHGIQNTEHATQLKELLDIVRWLPEIAGDSDLPEEKWNVVDQFSQQLGPLLQDQWNYAEQGGDVRLEPLHGSVSAALKQLRDVAGGPPTETTAANSDRRGHDHD